MPSLNDLSRGYYSRFLAFLSDLAKTKRAQDCPVPEPDLAQTPEASVTETDRSIPSDQPAAPEAISPQQELTDMSPCDCSIVEQYLRVGLERLTLGTSTAEKRGRPGCADDDDADGQPSAKRRKLSIGRSSHRIDKGRRGKRS
ncbi:hypothetical protein FMUND_13519 [Fusarium mundagurra]|uniref:Uncharacterized protein n=1 Tax=Fusarium mundagurra TaxID=1567541 RepID=A0A8H5XXY7_9HYPO|nr:hypothetical protein FMUND_13519 [Fusarium mundagurra]